MNILSAREQIIYKIQTEIYDGLLEEMDKETHGQVRGEVETKTWSRVRNEVGREVHWEMSFNLHNDL